MSKRSSFHAPGDVPFAWENKPGTSKVAPGDEELPKAAVGKGTPKLPPPPCPRQARLLSGQGLHIPLPPCPFQVRVSYQRSGWDDDPFLAAYMECTRSGRDQGRVVQKKRSSRRGEVFGVSCKNVRDVVEHGVVRLSQLPAAHLRGRNTAGKWRERDSREQRSLIRE